MKFNGYHHIGLIVEDAEKSVEFYKKLGAVETLSFPMGDTGKKIYLADLGGNAVVEIIPRGNAGEEASARFAHIAIATDDASAAFDLAVKAGAKPQTEPRDVTLGAMNARIAFVVGPDKETLEFFQVKS
ncbi:MAG: VOC family protein [Oscillospiraceae bacterium]|nr:VOC family protein [Oscillospiraceae bacterium]